MGEECRVHGVAQAGTLRRRRGRPVTPEVRPPWRLPSQSCAGKGRGKRAERPVGLRGVGIASEPAPGDGPPGSRKQKHVKRGEQDGGWGPEQASPQHGPLLLASGGQSPLPSHTQLRAGSWQGSPWVDQPANKKTRKSTAISRARLITDLIKDGTR